jgi:hypothetical protein
MLSATMPRSMVSDPDARPGDALGAIRAAEGVLPAPARPDHNRIGRGSRPWLITTIPHASNPLKKASIFTNYRG